jgi:hypothetical protein
MKRVSTLGIIAAAAFFCAAPLSLQWSPAKSPSLALDTANARIGHPGTAMSVAGVHRRAMRRTYGVGANLGRHPVARAAAVGAVAAGAGYGGWGGGWGGWGGGWGGWGWNNQPLYASAALGTGGFGMGGPGFGLGAAFCYPTFDYSTGWNQFCPGSGFAFGTGSNRPAQ